MKPSADNATTAASNASFWEVKKGKGTRDHYRHVVTEYLVHVTREFVEIQRFPWLTWLNHAWLHGLVLQGWGSGMPCKPGPQWHDKDGGSLELGHWFRLMRRIPAEFRENPHHDLSDGTLPLSVVRLADFLAAHPGLF